jgi:membrane-bound metal-dependent hydrolase YbcI (DUF457 family)
LNTQSHALMGAVLFGKKLPARAWAGFLGGVTPDVPMLLIVFTLMVTGVSANRIFEELYWQDWWQICNAIGHSFLLWSALLVLGLVMRAKSDRWTLLAIYSASALLHAFVDFLVHREDAHMSFWPLTRYKFMSPVSYYDPAHYGGLFSLFEAALGIFMVVVLIRRFQNKWARIGLAVLLVPYIAVPAFFILGRG